MRRSPAVTTSHDARARLRPIGRPAAHLGARSRSVPAGRAAEARSHATFDSASSAICATSTPPAPHGMFAGRDHVPRGTQATASAALSVRPATRWRAYCRTVQLSRDLPLSTLRSAGISANWDAAEFAGLGAGRVPMWSMARAPPGRPMPRPRTFGDRRWISCRLIQHRPVRQTGTWTSTAPRSMHFALDAFDGGLPNPTAIGPTSTH